MTTTQTRRTALTVRSEDCFEELDLGTVRRFVAECDAAGLDDGEAVRLEVHGDALHRLAAEKVDYEELDPPNVAQPAEADAEPADLRGGWVDPATGLISGGYPPVLEANDREAAAR